LEPYVWNDNSVVTNFNLTYKVLPQASLSAYVRNAFDEVYKTSVGITSTIPTNNTGTLSEPRTFGVLLSVRL
jgi:outer membrane receptor protein involved in Fe transport